MCVCRRVFCDVACVCVYVYVFNCVRVRVRCPFVHARARGRPMMVVGKCSCGLLCGQGPVAPLMCYELRTRPRGSCSCKPATAARPQSRRGTYAQVKIDVLLHLLRSCPPASGPPGTRRAWGSCAQRQPRTRAGRTGCWRTQEAAARRRRRRRAPPTASGRPRARPAPTARWT
jgi:hypothetical protein